MRRIATRGTVLLLLLSASGCSILNRPGETPRESVLMCAPERLAATEARFDQSSDRERELLEYCRAVQAAEALSASEEHLDFLADISWITLLLGAATVVLPGLDWW
jgi:hypothetical protein